MDKEIQEVGLPPNTNSMEAWVEDNPMDGLEQATKGLKPLVNHLRLLQWRLQPNPITTRIINIINNMPNNFLSSSNNMPQLMQPGNTNSNNNNSNNNPQEILSHSKKS